MTRGLRITLKNVNLNPEAVQVLQSRIERSTKRRAAMTFGGVKKQNERFEQLLAFQMQAAGLPEPERQVLFASGRKFAADFAWRVHNLLVEVQGGIWQRSGGGHSHPMHILRDIEKSQLAIINGWALFPVTTDQVKSGEALQLIEIALRARGWKR